jgi:FkbM family methyltransferase
VVSTAQHAGDLAVHLTERGHQVVAVASRRAYDDPRRQFATHEIWRDVHIHRLAASGFGKGTRWRRAADFASFLLSCSLYLLRAPRFDVVIALTTPPLIAFLAALFVRLKGGRLVYWVMDLNPDQAIAAGWLRADSLTARSLQALLAYALRRSDQVIVLDRFMEQRIAGKGIPREKIVITPPWSHDQVVRYDADGRREFRAKHGLSDKFVVMYSGNHSPCHPLDTVLQAARRLAADEPDTAFCFVGGGTEHAKVRSFAAEHRLSNVICLPYQPLEKLSASLSAADLHLVVMGDAFVGIVHPCKIYNVCLLGIPVLYIGPKSSHITDLFAADSGGGWFYQARHGDASAVVEQICRALSKRPLDASRQRDISAGFSQQALVDRMAASIERLDGARVSAGEFVTDSGPLVNPWGPVRKAFFAALMRVRPAQAADIIKTCLRIRRRETCIRGPLWLWVDPVSQFGLNILSRGVYEPSMTALVQRFLRPDDVFVDVGAAEGYFSTLAALRGAEVHSFEPQSRTLRVLRKNLELNGVTSRVHIHPVALSDEVSRVTLHLTASTNPGGSGMFKTGKLSRATESVATTTLDRALDGVNRVRLIKLDCEGAEERVVDGAQMLIEGRRVDFLVIEYHPMIGKDGVERCQRTHEGICAKGYLVTEVTGLRVYYRPELENELRAIKSLFPAEADPATETSASVNA